VVRVLLGAGRQIAGAGRQGGAAEHQESQGGQGGCQDRPRPACGAGSTFAMGPEGGDGGFLGAQLAGAGGRAQGVEQGAESGLGGSGGVADGQPVGLVEVDPLGFPGVHRVEKSA
jgi:hypothetical protein